MIFDDYDYGKECVVYLHLVYSNLKIKVIIEIYKNERLQQRNTQMKNLN